MPPPSRFLLLAERAGLVNGNLSEQQRKVRQLAREIAELKLEVALHNPPADLRRHLAVLEARYRNSALDIRRRKRLEKEMLLDQRNRHHEDPGAPGVECACTTCRVIGHATVIIERTRRLLGDMRRIFS